MSETNKRYVALRLLSWFCPDYLYEEIEGDLIQKFNKDIKAVGEKRAKRRLLWNVIRFFRPGIVLRNNTSMQINQFIMLSNYFKTSLRHIKRSKLNFGFKLGGLTLAIFSFLCMAIYVAYQVSYDTHHVDYSNIYRVNSERKNSGQMEKYGVVPLATGPLLKQYIPEIESFTRIRYPNGSNLVMRLPWTNKYPDGFIYVRYTGDAPSVIKSIENKYKVLMPGYPLNWFDVTMLYNRGHEKETQAYASLQFGTMIIVLISILGICAMAMFLSVKRMREFGIRKVLGASVMQISLLHIQYFVRLMLLACVIALPIAFLFMEEWLTAFAYRVELDYLPFLMVALTSVGAVILFASYSAWKSGRMNPVDIIKME